MWEALCWRRGSLRYYMVSTCLRKDLAQPHGSSTQTDAEMNTAAGRIAREHTGLIEEGVDALLTLLSARPDGCSQALSWGIYSTNHLLALAYLAEFSYWRWCSLDPGTDGNAASDEPARRLWLAQTLRLAHRYLHVVEVLMEGCGWTTDRSRELVRLVGGEAPLRALLLREWKKKAEVEREVARALGAPQ